VTPGQSRSDGKHVEVELSDRGVGTKEVVTPKGATGDRKRNTCAGGPPKPNKTQNLRVIVSETGEKPGNESWHAACLSPSFAEVAPVPVAIGREALSDLLISPIVGCLK